MTTLKTTAVNTPHPPYYTVFFTSALNDGGGNDYGEASKQMLALAKQQPGFLILESARQEIAISVSYWDNLEGTCCTPYDAITCNAVVQSRSCEGFPGRTRIWLLNYL